METDITKQSFPLSPDTPTRTPLTWRRLSFLERTLVTLLAGVALVSGMFFLTYSTHGITTVVPAPGGSIVEGIVGTPRFINPVLAQSNADRELTTLLFSGLMRALPDGTITTDIAESYHVSEDGMTYTVTLREDATFHDGRPITSADVLYTISRTQEPAIGSPLETVWAGIGVSAQDERTVIFTISQPYAAFLGNLTVGILPKHAWEYVSTEEFSTHVLNTEPIGSGPFSLARVTRNKSGIPSSYTLRAFKHSTRGRPHLSTIEIRIFGNQKELLTAFESKDIDSFDSIDPSDATVLRDAGVTVATYELPRVFGIFFNQNKSDALTELSVRQALELAVDTQRIVDEVLFGFGTAINGPLPPHLVAPTEHAESAEKRRERAATLLSDAGWERNTETGFLEKKDAVLRVTITTANTPELKKAGEFVVADWRALGVDTSLELFDTGQLHREIIRPRAYEALLFGQVVGRDGDLFPFWHSSQRNDPGLNVALYTSITADAILENIRTTLDLKEREDLFVSLVAELETDVPAVFLYTPNLLYVPPKHVSGSTVGVVHSPAERFLDVERWYTHTQRVLNVSAKEHSL